MPTEPDAAGKTVLIVDDEERILSALRRTLRREGYEIITVESARAALEVLDSREVDLVLTDQKMPGASGIELLERVAERRPAAARVLITGWTEEIPAEELERVGVHTLITKPWDDAELKGTLRKILAQGGCSA